MNTFHNFFRSMFQFLPATALLAIFAVSVPAGAVAQQGEGREGAPPVAAQTADTLKSAYKDLFLIGAAINRTIATDTAVLANNVNRNEDEVRKDTALVIKHFNQVSPENDLKWQLVHPNPGPDGYNWGPADAFVNFGVTNKMYIVGHTLVWHSQTPNWVFQTATPPPAEGAAATPPPAQEAKQPEAGATEGDAARRGRRGRGFGGRRGPTGPPATRDELLERMRNHIHAVVGRYKGKIKSWDVVNEAIEDNGEEVLRSSPWSRIIGPDFIAKAFQYAHEADPDAILRYNDYGLENPNKRKKLMTLIRQLQEQGVPVHAIGTQAHLNVSNATFERMDEALTEMATLGLPIHVTELDINGAQGGQRNTNADISQNAAATQGGLVSDADKRLADAYEGTFRAFVKHQEHVKVVTFWGANDAVSWRANGRPLLFDGNNQPKPAFDAVIRVAKNARKTVRIKAGVTTPFTDSNGLVWLPDQGFEGGSTIDRDPSTVIAKTKDSQLFLSERYSMDAFSFKVPNGKYLAKLYFAETFEGISGPNQRVFSFNVQGREFKDFDIWVKAGGPNRAYIESVPVEVTNGEFRIVFTSNIENPEINAIEIIPQD